MVSEETEHVTISFSPSKLTKIQ